MPESIVDRKDMIISEKKIYSQIILFTKSNQKFSIKPLISIITKHKRHNEQVVEMGRKPYSLVPHPFYATGNSFIFRGLP